MTGSLEGQTLFISGGSRGIGLEIAKRAAKDGANVAIASKTAEPHPTLPGTIYTAAEEIEAAGGKALPLLCDIREEDQVEDAIAKTAEHFGGIDICINNASAVRLTPLMATPVRRFDLMHGVNARGTFLVTQKCMPHLLKSKNPHVLAISPPLELETRWFAPHVAYSMAKYGMSMVILGVAGEFKGKVGVNALWPRTAIDTAAMAEFKPHMDVGALRSPMIMADAAHIVLTREAAETTGNFYIDDEVLASAGITDLSQYAPEGVADIDIMPDFFVESLREIRGLPDINSPYSKENYR
ncbi:MAG: NAD(P)-dependent oxidoreductase [Pseudomonadota bacterium]